MRIERRPVATMDLQIAPLVDLVFLLLVFFLVQPRHAAPVERGLGLNLHLPGTVAQAEAVPLPVTERIAIAADGRVTLNELPVGEPGDRSLSRLRAILGRFKEACDADRSPAKLTVEADDHAVHQRLADVLDACAGAGITGVALATEAGP
jgi:biopolymer transport protein ExbD